MGKTFWEQYQDKQAKTENFNSLKVDPNYLENLLLNITTQPILIEHNYYQSRVYEVKNFLPSLVADQMLDYLNKHHWDLVGSDGAAKNYKEGDYASSKRLATYSPKLAILMWEHFKKVLPVIRKMDSYLTCTDHENHLLWKLSGINPYFRFIQYTANGFLVPHYDGTYKFDEHCSTLMTCLIYLTDNETGLTQFLVDSQHNKKLEERIWQVNPNVPSKKDILLTIKPEKGKVLFFDQRLLHNTSEVVNEDKSLILSDLIFEKVY